MKVVYTMVGLALLFPACSRKSDVDLYNEGKTAEEQGNFQLAVDRYQEIVNRFQKSAYAESALYRSGLVYNNDLHDLPKAVGAYRKFYDLFPDSKQAPTALFLSGFLLNNEMHMVDSAKGVYQLFLQKYPNHELANSARFELETLGKDASALLRVDTAFAPESAPPAPSRHSKKRSSR